MKRKHRVREIKRKKTELLTLLNDDNADENKSILAAEELCEMGKSILVGDERGEEKLRLIRMRNMKLKKLQELL